MVREKIFNAIIILFLAASGFLIWRDYQVFVPVENPDVQLQGEAYNRYWEKLNEAYKKDPYGGDTPEETLNLFIEALKAGDLELASKYFVVEKQASMLEEFKNGVNSGGLQTLIKILDYEREGYYLSPTDFEFDTFTNDNDQEFSFNLVLNQQTNKWKMYEL